MTKYTWAEIAKHNTVDSLWLVINRKVYDVTKFTNDHPGGLQVFLENGGQDATNAFNSVSNHADDQTLPSFMETLCIGEVIILS
jgi:cytochrome b involved in lipid metabolism